MIYTVGDRADPQSVVREMVRSGRLMELGVTACHHECGRGQFEINLNHSEALDAADRSFRFKSMVKELAARHGLVATFMGKPFAGLDGIRRQLIPPPPLGLDAPVSAGHALPARLEDSLRALKDDTVLSEAMGWPLVEAFCGLKSAEAEQFRRAVTDWELNEYAWHL